MRDALACEFRPYLGRGEANSPLIFQATEHILGARKRKIKLDALLHCGLSHQAVTGTAYLLLTKPRLIPTTEDRSDFRRGPSVDDHYFDDIRRSPLLVSRAPRPLIRRKWNQAGRLIAFDRASSEQFPFLRLFSFSFSSTGFCQPLNPLSFPLL
ncbi:hypothetical protein VNO77_20198 [Canavalia gladiata]|uniref:Uncharacterized protein n=1 Tax=Canavalia gladiata TaxID=3824 RepID=A0AAN9LP68_CANGL